MFHGYIDPPLDAAAFDEQGYFRTGDLGVSTPRGYVTITGRLKDVIIRKGENISAKEVEDLLYEHPMVANVAVIGLPDKRSGERVCAVVERPRRAVDHVRADVDVPARARPDDARRCPSSSRSSTRSHATSAARS